MRKRRNLSVLPVRSVCSAAFTLSAVAFMPGCIVTTQQHNELEREVDELKKQVAARDKELEVTLDKARDQSEELDKLLRTRAATMGVRLDNTEADVADLRGAAEDNRNEVAAMSSQLDELQASVDSRITELETKLNQATDIPEGKKDLLREAERLLRAKDYKGSRRLFRTYISRYPEDSASAEVRFNIGLSLYSERDFRSALGEFYWVVQNAPDSSVINDSLYYSGLAFAKLGQCEKAIAYFKALSGDGSAPERYRSRADEQIKTLSGDDGTICTDRAADGGRVEGTGQPSEPTDDAESGT